MRIVVISDMHTGHIKGLNPRRVVEGYHTPNPFQKWVAEQFSDFISKYKDPDYLILNGDICDGNQSLAVGVEAITTNTDDQVNFAIELLNPLIGDNTKIHGIAGSGYHNSLRAGANLDRQVIEKLGGTYHGNIYELEIEGSDEKIQFKHDAGWTISKLDSEIKNIVSDSVKSKTKCPTMLVRSHGHTFLGVEKAGISAYITPCWQYLTDFMEKKAFKGTPDIGAFVIQYDVKNKILYSYSKIYNIPPEIIDAMRNLEIVDRDKLKEMKKKDNSSYYEYMRNRK